MIIILPFNLGEVNAINLSKSIGKLAKKVVKNAIIEFDEEYLNIFLNSTVIPYTHNCTLEFLDKKLLSYSGLYRASAIDHVSKTIYCKILIKKDLGDLKWPVITHELKHLCNFAISGKFSPYNFIMEGIAGHEVSKTLKSLEYTNNLITNFFINSYSALDKILKDNPKYPAGAHITGSIFVKFCMPEAIRLYMEEIRENTTGSALRKLTKACPFNEFKDWLESSIANYTTTVNPVKFSQIVIELGSTIPIKVNKEATQAFTSISVAASLLLTSSPTTATSTTQEVQDITKNSIITILSSAVNATTAAVNSYILSHTTDTTENTTSPTKENEDDFMWLAPYAIGVGVVVAGTTIAGLTYYLCNKKENINPERNIELGRFLPNNQPDNNWIYSARESEATNCCTGSALDCFCAWY